MRANTWDDVERLILTATREPATARQVTDSTGLTDRIAQAQLDVFQRQGLLIQTVDVGVRYELTLAGRQRLASLDPQPGHQAAA